ncbi:MAG: DUF368 domain-containing protein [Anaerolineales bacterium]|nr:DUF368 domain-containing protein [Anaerolineales bacterium]
MTINLHHNPKSFRDYLELAGRGFCMGAADVVPGVSGGTVAFILGIYEDLINAIHAVNLDFIRRLVTLRWRAAFEHFPWRFLLTLGLGIGAAIFTLAEGLNWALRHHPALVWAFFFGLVLASVFVVRKRVRRWTPGAFALAALTAVGAYLLVGLTPAQTPDAFWSVFLSGAIAICAMILPGISGAFILVLLGKYQYLLNAIIHLDLLVLAVFMAGCVAGILSFARLLRWLFNHYHDLTVAALTGLMLGSLRKVWPWKETLETITDRHGALIPIREANILPSAFTPEAALAIGLALLGVGLVLGVEYAARRPATAEIQRGAAGLGR